MQGGTSISNALGGRVGSGGSRHIPNVYGHVLNMEVIDLELTTDVLELLPRHSQVSFVIVYDQEDLSMGCTVPSRHVSVSIEQQATIKALDVNVVKNLWIPYFSPFPMQIPVLHFYLVQRTDSTVADAHVLCSAKLNLGLSYKNLPNITGTHPYDLFLFGEPEFAAAVVLIKCNLRQVEAPAKIFEFLWDDRRFPTLPAPSTASLDALTHQPKMSIMRKAIVLARSETNLPTSAIETLPEKETPREKVLLKTVASRRSPQLKFRKHILSGVYMDSSARSLYQKLSIPLYGHSDCLRVIQENNNVGDQSERQTEWTTLFNWYLDQSVLATSICFSMSDLSKRLDTLILQSANPLAISTNFAERASLFAKQIIDNEVFGAGAKFETANIEEKWQFEREEKDKEVKASLNSFNSSSETISESESDVSSEESSRGKGKFTYARLPPSHPFATFRLFQNDHIYCSMPDDVNFCDGLLATLVLGSDKVHIEEASKIYGLEIQAHEAFNNAIVKLKIANLPNVEARSSKDLVDNPCSILRATLIVAVDYRGFRVVVMPLPLHSITKVPWPPSISVRILHEVSFVERCLNLHDVLRPSWMQDNHDLPVLLQLSPSKPMKIIFHKLFTVFPRDVTADSAPGSKARRLRPLLISEIRLLEDTTRHQSTLALVKTVESNKQKYKSSLLSRQSAGTKLFTNLGEALQELGGILGAEDQEEAVGVERDGKGTGHSAESCKAASEPPDRRAHHLARLVKTVLVQKMLLEFESMFPSFPYDSLSLTDFVHRQGFNCRMLGQLAKQTRAPWLQHVLLVEIVARTVKAILRDCIRCIMLPKRQTVDEKWKKKVYFYIDKVYKGRNKKAILKGQQVESGQQSLNRRSLLFQSSSTLHPSFSLRDRDSVSTLNENDNEQKEELPLETLLPTPMWAAVNLLDEEPYKENLALIPWRCLSMVDILALNLFNLTFGSSVQSEEFWSDYLSRQCAVRFSVNAASIRQNRICLTALYVALQQHCGLSMYLCAAAFGNRLSADTSHPLQPADMKAWTLSVKRSVVLMEHSLPIYEYVRDPRKILLPVRNFQRIIIKPSASQLCLAKFIGLTMVAIADIYTLKDANMLGKFVKTSDFNAPRLDLSDEITRESWATQDAWIDVIGCAMRFRLWQEAKTMGLATLNHYPEAHVASVPLRILLLLTEAHGGFLPYPNPRLAVQTELALDTIKAYWKGVHPLIIDVCVAQAWMSYVAKNWSECEEVLEKTIFQGIMLSTRLDIMGSEPIRRIDLTCSSSSYLHEDGKARTARILSSDSGRRRRWPGPPPDLRTASLMQMLGNAKLMRMIAWKKRIDWEFPTQDARLALGHSACEALEWALDAFDFHLGGESLHTVSCAHELSAAMLLLRETKRCDEGLVLVTRAEELAAEALRLRVLVKGKKHIETIQSGFLLGVILLHHRRYARSNSVLEAVLRNMTLRTYCWFAQNYRPSNEFSRLMWSLDDSHFFGLPELGQSQDKLRGEGEAFREAETKDRMPILRRKSSTQSIQRSSKMTLRGVTVKTPEAESDTVLSMELLLPSFWEIKEHLMTVYFEQCIERGVTYRVIGLFLLLDFLEKQEFKSIENIERYFSSRWRDPTAMAHISSSTSVITWLLDVSYEPETAVLEYIHHYPFRIEKRLLLEGDGKSGMLPICSSGVDQHSQKTLSGTVHELILNLLAVAEKAVFDVHRRIMIGEGASDRPTASPDAITSPFRSVLQPSVMTTGENGQESLEEGELQRLMSIRSSNSLDFQRTYNNVVTEEQQDDLAFLLREEGVTETGGEDKLAQERRERVLCDLARRKSRFRLPLSMRSEALDILASLCFYFLDIGKFRLFWKTYVEQNRNTTISGVKLETSSSQVTKETETVFDITRTQFELVDDE